METKELIEAKKIVGSVANFLSFVRKKEYATRKLVKLDEVYRFSREFKASEPGHIELETTISELAKGNIIRNGIYLITNIWIFKDELHGYLASFVVRTGKHKEVIVYGENLDLHYVKPDELFFLFVCNGKTDIHSSYVPVKVANTYKLKGMDVYELHKQVVEFLDSFWFDNGCDAQVWLSVKERFKI